MCKRAYRHEQVAAAVGGYEGQTIRMDSINESRRERRHACGGHGFPWWSLWLIWPLIAVLKWAAPFYVGALAAFHSVVGAPERPASLLIAALLIVAGLALIRRSS